MRKLATLDIETDPFKYGRVPQPFACGFFDGTHYYQTWGDDCINKMLEYLCSYPEPLSIYAHNGGKFDWFYFSHVIDCPLKFIKGRLVQAGLLHHIVRDSFALLPAPLRDYKKDSTDYATFEYGVREKHKTSISEYLRADCVYLHELLSAFIENYGFNITIASAALKQLKTFYPLQHRSQEYDADFRPYYFGGRVQCFEKGYIKTSLKLYDINSSYPNVMRNYRHPWGARCTLDTLPDHGIYFADIVADSEGALPERDKFGLQFPNVDNHRFLACSHEIESGLNAGKLRIRKVNQCYAFADTIDFANFVDHFFNMKILAEKNGDAAMRLVYKLLLNNAYGKFAQNPDNFFDYDLDCPNREGWEPCGELGDRVIYRKAAEIKDSSYWDVAIGASITSAARAYLFDALQRATRPMSCDTDSLICTHLDAPLDQTRLGAWKLEAKGDAIAICGKKLYALFDKEKCVKAASKGLPTDPKAIKKLAMTGKPIKFELQAPSYKIGREPIFIQREARMT
jgi:hypothetical protein